LTRPYGPDVHLELELAQSYWAGAPETSARIVEDVAVRAAEAQDETGAALARAMAVFYGMQATRSFPKDLEALLLTARRRLEAKQDHAGLIYVWTALGSGVANIRGRFDDWAVACEEALDHARLAGRWFAPSDLGLCLIMGSRPADEALRTLDRLIAEKSSPWLLANRAVLLAMLDRANEAEQQAQDAVARASEISDGRWGIWILAEVAAISGDHEAASRHLLDVCEWLQATGQVATLSTQVSVRGRSLCLLGRFDEAEPLAERGRELVWDDDLVTQALWRQVKARVLAQGGDIVEAERLACEAVAIIARTDSLDSQGKAFFDLGEVLAVAGRHEDAAAAFGDALDRHRLKKNLAMAAQVQRRLDILRRDGR
jgi:tetratricopeptide (TPR) repeat protein